MPRGQKTCPRCEATMGPRTKTCPDCGREFISQGRSSTPPVPGVTTGSSLPPRYVPASRRTARACPTHPKYEAVNAPKAECEACWRMYLRDRFEDRVRPFDESIEIVANDPTELDRFIAALKSARDRNAHNGGGYVAFLHAKGGQVLQINVQVPIGGLRRP